jgi:uncharacterized membrane protein HdeD (DUF308 family)
MTNAFLLGIIAINSVWAGIFFLKFWRQTRDQLFLAFGIAFIIEGLNRAAVMLAAKPNEGNPGIYVVRMISALIILGAILRKNYSTKG